jgi:hypothetical protein
MNDHGTPLEESTSFLKKKQKTFNLANYAYRNLRALNEQKFFGSFFQKRTCFSCCYALDCLAGGVCF